MGATFKEDVRDLRNSRVFDLIRELESHGITVGVYDPLVGSAELQKLSLRAIPNPFQPHQSNKLYKPEEHDKPNKRYKRNKLHDSNHPQYDALILAVPHRAFLEKEPAAYVALLGDGDGPGVLVDVKGVLPCQVLEKAGLLYWSL